MYTDTHSNYTPKKKTVKHWLFSLLTLTTKKNSIPPAINNDLPLDAPTLGA